MIMKPYPNLGRWLAALITGGVFAGVAFFFLSRSDPTGPIGPGQAGANQNTASADDSWVMYGGHPDRNLVNTRIKGLPVDWDVDKKTNIRWVADLGSKAYGGPIV